MKTTLSLPRVALVALALGTASVTATFAQTDTNTATNPSPPSGGWHHHHHHNSVLTAAEKAELKTAREQAFAANGSLKTDADNLRQQLRSAELSINPNLAPIFAKLEAAHKAWQQQHSSTSTSTSTST